MASDSDSKERARQQIRGSLRRVPEPVRQGSHQLVVAYKQAVQQAQKALASPRSQLAVLQHWAAELSRFESPK